MTVEEINERISKLFSPVMMGENVELKSKVMTEEEVCIKLFLEALNYDEEMVNLTLEDSKQGQHFRNKVCEMGFPQLALWARKR